MMSFSAPSLRRIVRRPIRGGQKPGRNVPCPCGSGVKYKRCHGATPGQHDPSPVAQERG